MGGTELVSTTTESKKLGGELIAMNPNVSVLVKGSDVGLKDSVLALGGTQLVLPIGKRVVPSC